MRYTCQKGDDHAEGYTTCTEDTRRLGRPRVGVEQDRAAATGTMAVGEGTVQGGGQ